MAYFQCLQSHIYSGIILTSMLWWYISSDQYFFRKYTGCSETNRLCFKTWPSVNIQNELKSSYTISFWRTRSTSAKGHFWGATKTKSFNVSKNAPETALFKTLKGDIWNQKLITKSIKKSAKNLTRNLNRIRKTLENIRGFVIYRMQRKISIEKSSTLFLGGESVVNFWISLCPENQASYRKLLLE